MRPSSIQEFAEWFVGRNLGATGDWRAAAEDAQHRLDDLIAADGYPQPAQASESVQAAEQKATIGGDGFFAGIELAVDPSLPPETVEMRSGANRVRLNTSTGEMTAFQAVEERVQPVAGAADARESALQLIREVCNWICDTLSESTTGATVNAVKLARAFKNLSTLSEPKESERDKVDEPILPVVAWLIDSYDSKDKLHQTVELSPLTDDVGMDESSEAWALCTVENAKNAIDKCCAILSTLSEPKESERDKVDAQRYRLVKTMSKEMLLFWRGAYGCADEPIDALRADQEKKNAD